MGSETPTPETGASVSNDEPTETVGQRQTTTTASEAPSSTDRSTDTPTETDNRPEYPIGLSETGLEPVLADVHTSALMETAFTSRVVSENLTHTYRKITETKASNGEFLIHLEDPDDASDVYSPADEQLWRAKFESQWVYGVENDGWHRKEASAARHMRPFFKSAEFGRPETISENGKEFYRVEATGIEHPDILLAEYNADSIEELSITVEITVDGIIRSFSAQPVIVKDNTQILRQRSVRVTDIGDTSFSEPAWVSTAKSHERSFQLSLREDQRGIVYRHDGGPPVIAGSEVGIDSPPELTPGDDTSTLESPFKEGESFVAYVDGEDLAHSRNGIPSDAETKRIPLDGWTWLQIGLGKYFDTGIEAIA